MQNLKPAFDAWKWSSFYWNAEQKRDHTSTPTRKKCAKCHLISQWELYPENFKYRLNNGQTGQTETKHTKLSWHLSLQYGEEIVLTLLQFWMATDRSGKTQSIMNQRLFVEGFESSPSAAACSSCVSSGTTAAGCRTGHRGAHCLYRAPACFSSSPWQTQHTGVNMANKSTHTEANICPWYIFQYFLRLLIKLDWLYICQATFTGNQT